MSVDQQTIAKYQQTLEELRAVTLSIQQYRGRLLEIERTLKALEQSQGGFVYRSMGNILIQTPREEVMKELNSEKELLQLRLEEFTKREKLLRERLASLEKQLRSALPTSSGAG
ncbi:prefoldin subunit [Thermofilum pendens]|uniref:Prefoldin subunit beta n=1 Tax=Thermofilum pendens (strain DSM 2475 / Hrk 5) TaxID=368408 RepID=A1RXX8_THEPD|nr:prefoldin subunit [Thermofilum pendens]ABL78058.1 Prefoldin beta- domain protein [Thermofilum pendens Hrk 5]